MAWSETLLPDHLLERATRRGNERAWPIHDIPEVIEAARQADLVSVGGQLQLRFPEGGTCECYWVEVDTFKSVSPNLPWLERVEQTAAAARSQFQRLLDKYDFTAEARSSFGKYMDEFVAKGGDINDAIYFVWYLAAQQDASERA
ncbi:hypothetical protein [Sphingomonas astaxanthinifaciens]|uniref:Uncharacterized protein n=1 Tax=Sphingomonas astaxanthinifaciens DSM 22298 TaxID=1123267 RepID=A0ABQ5Z8T7_9SPHN|nr:hypothetical protein [Sphingomonas astaxanthinifaciens]GLR47199.1 hypothetical protein GCM10007925_09100 [Sphingomonas astaxanthinifaciens DSM 22298]